MEARATFRESTVSKNVMTVVLALVITFLAGGIGGYLVKSFSLPVATSALHIVAGEPGASEPGTAWNYTNRRGGIQSIEGPATGGSSVPQMTDNMMERAHVSSKLTSPFGVGH
jgi:hypothetical protein